MKNLINPAVVLKIFPITARSLLKVMALASLVLVPPALQAGEAALPDQETMNRLHSGEIVAQSTRLDESGASIQARLMIWAPVEDIWATVYSCENAFIFLEGLEICEVPEDDGVDTITRQVINKGWPLPRQDYSFHTHRVPYTRADIELVEGKLKFMQAGWEYVSMPGVVLVTYTVRLQPQFPAPKFLLRRILKSGMVKLLTCVRGLAGGSGSAEREQDDLDDCPGDVSKTPE